MAINFVMPTPQQLLETEKFRKSISILLLDLEEMKEEEKLMIVNDIMKIKR